MSTPHLRVGDRVKSRAVGCVPAFTGVIVMTFVEDRKKFYHVRRKDGVIWHRDPGDIKRVTTTGKRL